MYQPELGRFMQPDPKEFAAGDYNLYRYCHNDPVNKTDPLGLYGMGTGWNIVQWRTFDNAQQAAADRLEYAASHMDAGQFEKVFGKGTATAENMAKVAATMRNMVTALRDHGAKGYLANVVQHREDTTLARGAQNGKTIAVDVSNEHFHSRGFLIDAIGHEAGHNFGLSHGEVDGHTAYRRGFDGQRQAYHDLPPAQALQNPDKFMEYAQ